MATTTNYSWTTPDDTDLVKDGASAIRTLGSAIDTTVFTNAGAAVAKATVDAKGDLLVGTADNTVDRLAVGTDGFTLVADSVEATGLKWVAPTAGGFVGCRLYNTTTQSISHGTATALTWDSEAFDTDAFHSTSVNTSRITIPSGKNGKYKITIQALWDIGTSTVFKSIRLKKNGTTNYLVSYLPASSGSEIYQNASITLDLVATDYIEFFCNHESAGSVAATIFKDETYATFEAIYLGA